MTGKPENPPAFPECGANDDVPGWTRGGMTLRDWFAGQALAGICAEPNERPDADEELKDWRERLAIGCYNMADAMLAERSKP